MLVYNIILLVWSICIIVDCILAHIFNSPLVLIAAIPLQLILLRLMVVYMVRKS